MVSKEDLKNEDNLRQCECGSFAHIDHVYQNDEGQNSCPECNQEWLNDIIKMYKGILTGNRSLKETNELIKEKIAKMMMVDVVDIDEDFFEYYLIKDED